MKKFSFLLFLSVQCIILFAQEPKGVPTDYLTKGFHASRRDSLRKIMPDNSVAVIFAFPTRTFSNDVTYSFHQNPDLYYFSGYKEPNAVLLIFKDAQTAPDGKTYKEIFFVEKRDSAREIWTGRRLGVEGVKSQLGFDMVFNGSEFKNFPISFSKFDKILFDAIPTDVPNDPSDSADQYDLIQQFKAKANVPATLTSSVMELYGVVTRYANRSMLPRILAYIQREAAADESIKNDPLVGELMQVKDSVSLAAVMTKMKAMKFSSTDYNNLVGTLREIKTPEEMELLRKSIEISSIAHAEVMKAIKPEMSELEVQGLHEYIHKRYGAEWVGYPSIVGAGDNGCVLHYEENSRTKVGTDMVLMDVGAEYHGYSADVTRTVPAKGKFSPEEKQIYNLVYDAQEAVFKICKNGTPFPELNKVATDVLADGLLKLGIIKNKAEVTRYYPHGCSHHLGLDVHDKSNYGPLKDNMVITVEPGIYIPPNSPCDKKWWGIAVRIEDDVRVDKNTYELLSAAAPRKAEDVEKMCAQSSAIDNFSLPRLPSDKKAF